MRVVRTSLNLVWSTGASRRLGSVWLAGLVLAAHAAAAWAGRGGATDGLALADLPLPGQAVVAAALGRDDTAYHVGRAGDGYRVGNPRHGFTARLSSEGLEVTRAGRRWGLALAAWGRDGALARVARVEPTAAANRIVYRRGAFEEWYVNGPLGLEQGFTVADPPHEGAAACRPAPAGSGGCGARGPLVFELAMTGGLRGEVEDGGRALALHGPDGAAVLRFAGVGAWDRDGRELRAWLERREGVVQLRVDDAGARYPIIVDPFLQSAKLTASDGAAQDELGWSVAASGDTVVLGAPGHSGGAGAAYVFAKPVTGWATMTESFKLTASDGAADDRFGWSVAVSGDTIVVGAPRDDLGIQRDAGSAYVFVMSMGTPVQVAKLTASDSLTDKRFGESVAIDGDTVAAGAPGDTSGQGAAYVFVKPAGGWVSGTQTAKLTASDGAANDGLGFAVAVSGDTVVAGAPFDDIGTATQRGSAYVFVKPVMGWATGTQTAKLTASGGVGGDLFGASVAIAGDTAVVGAPSVGDGRGAAYVFVKPAGGWANGTQAATLTASDAAAGDGAGGSVAIAGDTVVVGAPSDDITVGALYVFVKPMMGWTTMTETEKAVASTSAVQNLGFSVAIAGDAIVAGAPFDDGARGSARVFEPGDVVANGCPALPRGGCDTPRRSQILIEDHDDDAKDRIDLKFTQNAPARERGEFGDPTAGATYVACVWEGGTLIAQLEAPAGPAWKTVKSRSYRYTDPTLASDGVKSVKIAAGSPGKPTETQAIVIGRGTNLPDPAVPLASPVFVTAQILDLGSRLCIGDTFTDAETKANGANASGTVRTFKAKKAP